jgi:hypothetical protein
MDRKEGQIAFEDRAAYTRTFLGECTISRITGVAPSLLEQTA